MKITVSLFVLAVAVAVGLGFVLAPKHDPLQRVLGESRVPAVTVARPLLAFVDSTDSAQRVRVLPSGTESPVTLLTVDPARSVIDAIALSDDAEQLVYAEHDVRDNVTRFWSVELATGLKDLLGFTTRGPVSAMQIANGQLLYQEEATWWLMRLDTKKTVRVADSSGQMVVLHNGRSMVWPQRVGDEGARHSVYAASRTLNVSRFSAHEVVRDGMALGGVGNNELIVLKRVEPVEPVDAQPEDDAAAEEAGTTAEETTIEASVQVAAAAHVLVSTDLRGKENRTIAEFDFDDADAAKNARIITNPATGVILLDMSDQLLWIDGDEQTTFDMRAQVLGFISDPSGQSEQSGQGVLLYSNDEQAVVVLNTYTGATRPYHAGTAQGLEMAVWQE